ncbi:MAG: acyltransferase [Desulfomicrobium sp.]|nr:acyltransferase [Desulfomicrobium sp.]
MAYYTEDQLKALGFKYLGKNIKISDKASIYDCDQIEIGDNSRIDDFCVISGRVVIGRFCHVTPMCLIAGGRLGVFFDDFVTLSYGVKIFSQSDDYTGATLTNSLIPKKFKNEFFSKVVLNKHVIVGANSLILPGVEIGEGCAIGAATTILKDTKPWGVYIGCPAKRIKDRKKDLLLLEKQFLIEHSL